MIISTNDLAFVRYVPMVRIANVPGHYTTKIAVTLANSSASEFYLDYENVDGQWAASNACVFCVTNGINGDGVIGVRRVVTPNSDALEFALHVANTQSTANVVVTTVGEHDEGVITIPTTVPDGCSLVSYDQGYNEKGWTRELGRLQKYQDIFSAV